LPAWSLTTLTEHHLDQVIAIENASFKYPWKRASFESELENTNAQAHVVVCGQQQIIAYTFLRRVYNELHVLKIAVASPWRRCGVATWLMNRCFLLARKKGVESVCLEVRPSNEAARAFYTKLGFKIIETKIKYYADTGEDALVLKKRI
jgi:ribosomal-protein-alanine N-acetyltransferase